MLPTSTWLWANCCTDGGALTGPFDQAFEFSITPSFPLTGGLNPGNITTWVFLTGSLSNPTLVELDKTAPLTIKRVSTP